MKSVMFAVKTSKKKSCLTTKKNIKLVKINNTSTTKKRFYSKSYDQVRAESFFFPPITMLRTIPGKQKTSFDRGNPQLLFLRIHHCYFCCLFSTTSINSATTSHELRTSIITTGYTNLLVLLNATTNPTLTLLLQQATLHYTKKKEKWWWQTQWVLQRFPWQFILITCAPSIRSILPYF